MPTTKQGIVPRPNVEPTHPGEILREDVLPALGLSVSQAAAQLGVTRQSLYRILNKQASVSPEMALRLGKFCGNGPELWLQMQGSHDLWAVRKRAAKELKRVVRARPPRVSRAA